jgi:hypothetical protein
MTKLLATIESTEALAYARRWIERAHRDDEGSFFEAPHSRAFVRSFFNMMMLTADGRTSLLVFAREGEAYSQEIVATAIAECRSRGVEPPAEFVGYEIELIQGKVPPPVSTPGPDKRDDILRDISIATTVAAVVDRYGLKPTGRSARKRSACAVVAEALGVINRQVSPKAVEDIWRRYKRGMPTVRGWTLSAENQ